MACWRPWNKPRMHAARLGRWHIPPNIAATMAKKEIRHPDKEKSTGAYSAAVEIDGWVYVSGQGPVDPKTAQPVRGTIEQETELTLRYLEKILQAAGCSRADVVDRK